MLATTTIQNPGCSCTAVPTLHSCNRSAASSKCKQRPLVAPSLGNGSLGYRLRRVEVEPCQQAEQDVESSAAAWSDSGGSSVVCINIATTTFGACAVAIAVTTFGACAAAIIFRGGNCGCSGRGGGGRGNWEITVGSYRWVHRDLQSLPLETQIPWSLFSNLRLQYLVLEKSTKSGLQAFCTRWRCRWHSWCYRYLAQPKTGHR